MIGNIQPWTFAVLSHAVSNSSDFCFTFFTSFLPYSQYLLFLVDGEICSPSTLPESSTTIYFLHSFLGHTEGTRELLKISKNLEKRPIVNTKTKTASELLGPFIHPTSLWQNHKDSLDRSIVPMSAFPIEDRAPPPIHSRPSTSTTSVVAEAQSFSEYFNNAWQNLNQDYDRDYSTNTLNYQQLQLASVQLQQKINEAAIYLPDYDLEKYHVLLRQFQSKLQATQTQEKPKFSFSKFKRPVTSSSATPSQSSAVVDALVKSPVVEFKEHVLQYCGGLELPRLQLSHYKHSILIYSQKILGSVFLSHLEDCLVILRDCQQLRMHSSTQVTLCYAVSSDPIIEDCHAIRVASFPDSDLVANKFDQIKDFNWLFTEPNPHWTKVSEENQGILNQTLSSLISEPLCPGEADLKMLQSKFLVSQDLCRPLSQAQSAKCDDSGFAVESS